MVLAGPLRSSKCITLSHRRQARFRL